jgi:hypothetical protein
MWDGINTDVDAIAKVIQPGDLVAYYIDGLYAWSAADIARFPHNQHITITVLGNPADVADCETYDLTPDGAARWVRRQKAAGYLRPTIYRSFSVMQDIRTSTAELIMGKDWDAWVAHYDGSPAVDYPGEVAKQYRAANNWDKSVVYDDQWPHRTAPQPWPPVTAPRWPAGQLLMLTNKGNAVMALQRALSTSGLVGSRGIAVDGIFGNQTLTAVRNFQDGQGLAVDGLAGDNTRNALVRIGQLNTVGQAI